MLQFDAVSLLRGQREVLHNIGLHAAVGTVTLLLGPNGAGKSSLLALAAGELSASAGTIRLHGRDLRQFSPAELARLRAALPQTSGLAFDFRVRDLALLGAQPFPEITPSDLASLLESVLSLVDVAHLSERLYTSLSGGERQRAQLARVLMQGLAAAASQSGLILLDEPTASLDPRHTHWLLASLHQIVQSLPLAVVASVHDVNLALRYADQVWLLEQGRVAAAGAPDSVLTPQALARVFGLPATLVAGAGVVFG